MTGAAPAVMLATRHQYVAPAIAREPTIKDGLHGVRQEEEDDIREARS